MKQIRRKALGGAEASYLRKRQASAISKRALNQLHIENDWNSARRTKKLNTVRDVLKDMVGELCPCMWCQVSLGCDIDHFWPKSDHPDRMYLWENMLLSCTECGRFKGVLFPLDCGNPVLIDPTAEDPWCFLDFDPTTGNIGPRYDGVLGIPMPRGVATVDALRLDRREALAVRYKRSFTRISRVVRDFMQTPSPFEAFWNELNQSDDYGLLGWCFQGLGETVAPMVDLKSAHPDIWASCVTELQAAVA